MSILSILSKSPVLTSDIYIYKNKKYPRIFYIGNTVQKSESLVQYININLCFYSGIFMQVKEFKRCCKTSMIQIPFIDLSLLSSWATFRKTSVPQTQNTWKSFTLCFSFLTNHFPSINHSPCYLMCLLLINDRKTHPTQAENRCRMQLIICRINVHWASWNMIRTNFCVNHL